MFVRASVVNQLKTCKPKFKFKVFIYIYIYSINEDFEFLDWSNLP